MTRGVPRACRAHPVAPTADRGARRPRARAALPRVPHVPRACPRQPSPRPASRAALCARCSYAENISRRVFGLPRSHLDKVQRITDTTALFLFNCASPACPRQTLAVPSLPLSPLSQSHTPPLV